MLNVSLDDYKQKKNIYRNELCVHKKGEKMRNDMETRKEWTGKIYKLQIEGIIFKGTKTAHKCTKIFNIYFFGPIEKGDENLP